MGLSPGCDLWKHLRPTMREIKWTVLRAVDPLPVGNVSIASTFFNFQLVARNTRVVDCIKIRIRLRFDLYSNIQIAKLIYYTRKKFFFEIRSRYRYSRKWNYLEDFSQFIKDNGRLYMKRKKRRWNGFFWTDWKYDCLLNIKLFSDRLVRKELGRFFSPF